jgi:hypothetical protein
MSDLYWSQTVLFSVRYGTLCNNVNFDTLCEV